jgi:hypothetical protein
MNTDAENFARALADAEDESMENLEAASDILDRARKMIDGEVRIGDPLAEELGFTADRFDGYLWLVGTELYVSLVDAKVQGQGHFRAFVEKALAKGLTVKIPTPLGRMEVIVRRWGFEHTVEPSEIGACEVWVRREPLPPKEKP